MHDGRKKKNRKVDGERQEGRKKKDRKVGIRKTGK